MHPQIIKIIKRHVNRKKNKLIVIDAPLLIEAGLGELVDVLIVVKATKYNQLIRTRNKFHLSDREIIKRISTQLSLDNKIKLADFVVDNNGTITETRKQVKRIWERIKS
jgi:dephospho-CoA kinase